MGDLPPSAETSHADYTLDASSESFAQPRPPHTEDGRPSVGAMRTAIASSKNNAVSGLDMNRNPSSMLAFPKPSTAEGDHHHHHHHHHHHQYMCEIACVCVCVCVRVRACLSVCVSFNSYLVFTSPSPFEAMNTRVQN
jgi:hypothetical protein